MSSPKIGQPAFHVKYEGHSLTPRVIRGVWAEVEGQFGVQGTDDPSFFYPNHVKDSWQFFHPTEYGAIAAAKEDLEKGYQNFRKMLDAL